MAIQTNNDSSSRDSFIKLVEEKSNEDLKKAMNDANNKNKLKYYLIYGGGILLLSTIIYFKVKKFKK